MDPITEITALVQLGLQTFLSVWALFHHPTTPIPTSAAPQLVAMLQATPGMSDKHKAVVGVAVDAASKS